MEDRGFDYDSISEQTERDISAPYRMSRTERQERLLIVLMCIVALFSFTFMVVVIHKVAAAQQAAEAQHALAAKPASAR